MKHKRTDLLLLSILCFLICLFAIIRVANAESDFSWLAQTGIKASFASSAGYSPGIGVETMLGGRWKFLELRAVGDYLIEKKKSAMSGRTYGVSLNLRGYVWKSFYAKLGYTYSGYWSDFLSGFRWEKHGNQPTVGGGYNDGNTEVELTYFFQENNTPNNVWAAGVKLQQRLWKGLFGVLGITYVSFLQSGEREDGVTTNLGLAWRF